MALRSKMQRSLLDISRIVGVLASETQSDRLVGGRSRQALRLLGYRLSFSAGLTSPIAANGEIFEALVLLQTINRDWGLSPNLMALESTSARGGWRGSGIDLVQSFAVGLEGTGFMRHDDLHRDSGWCECDLLVPELAVYMTEVNSRQTGIIWHVAVEYEWVTVSVSDIAAINLVWNRDPSDFDRS